MWRRASGLTSEVHDGTCADFIWGLILGFVFGFIFLIVVFICKMNRMQRSGVMVGFVAHVFFNVMVMSRGNPYEGY